MSTLESKTEDFEPGFTLGRTSYARIRTHPDHHPLPEQFGKTNTPEGGVDSYSFRITSSAVALEEYRPRQDEAPLTGKIKCVDGTIETIDEFEVAISCQLPSGNITIQLPRSVLPDGHSSFGDAVSILLDPDSSYRRLKVEPRVVTKPIHTDEVDRLRDWIEKQLEE